MRTKKIRKIVQICYLVTGVSLLALTITHASQVSITTDEEAVVAAKSAVDGRISIPGTAPVKVTFDYELGIVMVTFVQIPIPNALHGDYHAYVELELTTGKPVLILGPQ
jgi:hypothetical protein